MNDPIVKAALGANPDVTYETCNLNVNQAFMLRGDGMRNSAALLTDLVNDGLRLLIYDGNFGELSRAFRVQYTNGRTVDLVCNIIVSCDPLVEQTNLLYFTGRGTVDIKI
jgi:hypothetical protein